MYCACHATSGRGHGGASAPQLLQEPLSTAPATQQAAAATAAPIRAAAPSGGSVYCACHATTKPRPRRRQSAPQLLQESEYCACHATSSRGHGSANPRRSSFRRRCVLRLPHRQPRPRRRQSAPQLLQEALCTAPATQQRAAATAAPIRTAAPSGGSKYCACHATSSRGHGGANPRRTSFRRGCVLRLPHKEQPRPRRRQLCVLRLSVRSGGSVYCACHATTSRGHGGANPRRSSFRRL